MKRATSRDDFDQFTRQRISEIGTRFNDARRAHRRAERLLWLGTLAAGFDDDELSEPRSRGRPSTVGRRCRPG